MIRRVFPAASAAALLFAALTSPRAEALGLKNFRELRAAYDVTFGVTAADPDLEAAWRGAADRLPLRGVVEEMSSPFVLAATDLAGAYCGRAITADAAHDVGDRSLFDEVDFGRGPEQFVPFLRDRLLTSLAASLWMRRPSAAELASLGRLVDEIGTDKAYDPAQTPKVLLTACTVFASSIEFLKK